MGEYSTSAYRDVRAKAEKKLLEYIAFSSHLFSQVSVLERLAKGWRPKPFE